MLACNKQQLTIVSYEIINDVPLTELNISRNRFVIFVNLNTFLFFINLNFVKFLEVAAC